MSLQPLVAPTHAATGALARSVVPTFQRWLHLPDPGALYAVLGAAAANLMPGDPVWLLLVGPPGGGKTELLQSVGSLSEVHQAATLTEAALLSGTPKREKAEEAKGGLLRVIGGFGIIVCKDLGSVLSMHRDARAAVLAALREIYDGSWTRHVGTDGGRTLHWSGKVGLLAGCTPTIDNHHAVMGSMGERFCLYRLPPIDEDAQSARALDHVGQEAVMRAQLSQAVAELFAGLDLGRWPLALDATDKLRLRQLAILAVRCRSAVERDPYSREVELIPEPETPARLTLVLARLLGGLDAIGVEREAAWQVVTKVALDSMTALRRAVLGILLETNGSMVSTTVLAERIGYPNTTSRRALEDLAAHRVIERHPQGQGKPDLWQLSERTRERWSVVTVPETSQGGVEPTVPETSDNLFTTPLRIGEDFSGTPDALTGPCSCGRRTGLRDGDRWRCSRCRGAAS